MEADSLTTKGFSTEQITTVQEAWSEPGRERDNGANELAQGGKSAEGNTETSRTVVDSSNGHSPSTPPPLPPRPNTTHLSSDLRQPPTNFLKDRSTSFRPRLQTYTTTTKVSFTDVVTHALPDGTRDTFASTAVTSNAESASVVSTPGKTGLTQEKDANSEVGDSESRRSYAPTIQTDGDVESLLGEVLRVGQPPQLSHHLLADSPFNVLSDEDEDLRRRLEEEFMISDEQEQDWRNEGLLTFSGQRASTLILVDSGALQQRWKSRLKHFLILSSAGKPIYSRHGEDSLISEYIGVVQTIISSFQDANDSIKGFTAGNVVFVILAQGPLYLVAISHLQESETQLLAQLEALYMQILSTLTLPSLTSIFSHRPSTDLRKPLQGTEALLSALADAFTRGSPATLLSALECLRIRKAQRTVIESTLLKTKVPSLLYGLIVAGGRLVSVIRPRRHSLHPSDLQLIFNMLFEAGRVKVGEGENWIPLCLPAFNNRGYLYMYVSFLVDQPEDERSSADTGEKEDQVAVLLISAEKESFYELKRMRDNLVEVWC